METRIKSVTRIDDKWKVSNLRRFGILSDVSPVDHGREMKRRNELYVRIEVTFGTSSVPLLFSHKRFSFQWLNHRVIQASKRCMKRSGREVEREKKSRKKERERKEKWETESWKTSLPLFCNENEEDDTSDTIPFASSFPSVTGFKSCLFNRYSQIYLSFPFLTISRLPTFFLLFRRNTLTSILNLKKILRQTWSGPTVSSLKILKQDTIWNKLLCFFNLSFLFYFSHFLFLSTFFPTFYSFIPTKKNTFWLVNFFIHYSSFFGQFSH